MEDNVYEKLAEWLATTFRALPGVNGPEFKDLIHFLYILLKHNIIESTNLTAILPEVYQEHKNEI